MTLNFEVLGYVAINAQKNVLCQSLQNWGLSIHHEEWQAILGHELETWSTYLERPEQRGHEKPHGGQPFSCQVSHMKPDRALRGWG